MKETIYLNFFPKSVRENVGKSRQGTVSFCFLLVWSFFVLVQILRILSISLLNDVFKQISELMTFLYFMFS